MDIKERCPDCNSEIKYNQKYDCFYCEQCNKWLEGQCNDPCCEFCTVRPEKPIT